MSNPIGDSADYFIQRNQLLQQQQQQQQGGSSPDVLQRQQGVDTTALSDDTRRKASANTRPTRRIQSTVNPPFDARHQWQRVMDKLAASGGGGSGSGEHSTSTTPTHSDIQRHSHPNRRYLPHHYSLSHHPQRHSSYRYHDDSESDENHSYEMQPTRDAYTEPDQEDDALPSPTDIERERQASLPPEGEPSYFTHPFQQRPIDTEEEHVQEEEEQQPGPSHEPTRPEQAHVPGHHARMQWSKTLDKIRLISNIQHLPSKPSPPAPHEPSNSLAPYFQPAFEAPFISLSRDEHGRKLVSSIEKEAIDNMTSHTCAIATYSTSVFECKCIQNLACYHD